MSKTATKRLSTRLRLAAGRYKPLNAYDWEVRRLSSGNIIELTPTGSIHIKDINAVVEGIEVWTNIAGWIDVPFPNIQGYANCLTIEPPKKEPQVIRVDAVVAKLKELQEQIDDACTDNSWWYSDLVERLIQELEARK